MAPRKGKRKVGESAETNNAEENRFSNAEAEFRYSATFGNMDAIVERGFIFNGPDVEEFRSRVSAYHWETFCKHPRPGIRHIVREFYANWNRNGIYVRGILVPFNEQVLRELLGLNRRGGRDDYTHLLNNCDRAEVLRVVGRPGAVWKYDNESSMTLETKDLTYQARVWLHFIVTRLMPTSNVSQAQKDRIVLIYCILTDRHINVARLLLSAITNCAERPGEKLWFPSIITELCQKARVPMEENTDRFTGKKALDNAAVKSMKKKDIKEAPTPGAAKLPGASSSGSKGEKDIAEQTLAYVRSHHRQFREWVAYETQRDQVVEERLEELAAKFKMTRKTYPTPPVFSEDVDGDDEDAEHDEEGDNSPSESG